MRATRLREWHLAVGSFVVSGVVAFAVGEAYVRLSKPYTTPDTVREKSLEYEATVFARKVFPQMTQTVRNQSGVLYVNARGYRGRNEFAVPKADGTIRIVFLGGSTTFDGNARDGRDWPHLVEQDLRARGFTSVEVINAATPGHSTWESLGRLYSEIWMFEPDYVVVSHAWNDIKYFQRFRLDPQHSLLRQARPVPNHGKAGQWRTRNPFKDYTGPLDRLLTFSQLYVRLRTRYWRWRLGKIGLEGLLGLRTPKSYPDDYNEWAPRQYELNLRLIVNTTRNIGAKPILLTQPRLVNQHNTAEQRDKITYRYVELSHKGLVQAFTDVDKATFNVARLENVDVLDIAGTFSGQSELFLDHVHTTPKGSEAIAAAVSEYLAKIIGTRQ